MLKSFYSILKNLVVSTPAFLVCPLFQVPIFPVSFIFVVVFFRKCRTIFVLTPTNTFLVYLRYSVEWIEQKLLNIEWNTSSLSLSVAFCCCIQSGARACISTVYVQVLLQANQCDDVVQGVILVNKGEITMFTHNESTSLVCIRSIFGTHPLDDAYEKQFVLFFPTRWITSFICIFKLSDFIGSVSLSLSFPPSWRILFSVFFCFFFIFSFCEW